MTDEEKWEKWRNKNAEIIRPYGGRVHKHIVWHEGVDRRKAFLDGLAEGRKEKWHDLRKDPNDLPRLESNMYSWSITVANQLGEACHYSYSKACWETPFFTEIEGVIAWCELPKFKEK